MSGARDVDAVLDQQLVAIVRGRQVSRKELSDVFDLVKDSKHWKNPIDAEVELTADQRALLEEAIPFFTGSVATFQFVSAKRNVDAAIYRVQAVGYFLAVGA